MSGAKYTKDGFGNLVPVNREAREEHAERLKEQSSQQHETAAPQRTGKPQGSPVLQKPVR